jgi:hypothetical protein
LHWDRVRKGDIALTTLTPSTPYKSYMYYRVDTWKLQPPSACLRHTERTLPFLRPRMYPLNMAYKLLPRIPIRVDMSNKLHLKPRKSHMYYINKQKCQIQVKYKQGSEGVTCLQGWLVRKGTVLRKARPYLPTSSTCSRSSRRMCIGCTCHARLVASWRCRTSSTLGT